MNGREAVGAAVLAAVCFAAGVIDRPNHQAPHPAPKPTPSVTADARAAYWAPRIEDAIDGRDSAHYALNSQPVTHQPLNQLIATCGARIEDYNATAAEAGPYWPAYIQHPLDPSKECTP